MKKCFPIVAVLLATSLAIAAPLLACVQITLGNEDGHEVLELSVFLPEAQRGV